MARIPHAPTEFSGTLEELFCHCIEPALPPPASVERIHHHLVRHLTEPGALLHVREFAGRERRTIEQLVDGAQILWTDNTPAWAMHRLAFQNEVIDYNHFVQLIRLFPTHFHDSAHQGQNETNRAGWYVAHLLQAKPRSLTSLGPTPANARQLFIRNIHPANHFLIPKSKMTQAFSSDGAVLGFIRERFSRRYCAIWSEFIELAGDAHSEFESHCSGGQDLPFSTEPLLSKSYETYDRNFEGPQYRDSRFAFKNSVIEPLDWEDQFQMNTPVGNYRLTKRQFYAEFPNVVKSADYGNGRYHYPTVPKRAARYLIPSEINPRT